MPAEGPSMSGKLSRIQVRSRKVLMRPGGITADGPARPSTPIVVTRIAFLVVNVWIDAVCSRIALTPGRFKPRSRARYETATTTSSSIQSACHRRTRRYAGFIGTLVSLWQRQNDVSFALAAQRRTTAASPTRAAANSTLRTSRRLDRFHTICVPREATDFKRDE